MATEAKVSIIIPFYNEEICLPRAVQSAINQSYSNTEIILVNDGSTDKSRTIAEEFSKKNSNIKLINSTQGEPGAARNKGIVKARGTYLVFLDADDELETRMVELCVEKIIPNNCDIINVGHTLYDEKGGVLKVFKNSSFTSVLSGIETIKAVYNNKVFPTSWAKLFKTELIKNIKFPEKMWFQDNPFFLEVLFNVSRVGFIEDSLMKAHSRSNSITRRLISLKRIADTHKAFLIEFGLSKKYVINKIERTDIDKLIFKNYIRAMLDNFIVLIIDKKKIETPLMQEIRERYLGCLNEAKLCIIGREFKFPLKSKGLFFVLSSPKYIGWHIPEFIISILKYKRVRHLKALKG